jgi:hypothetical protein
MRCDHCGKDADDTYTLYECGSYDGIVGCGWCFNVCEVCTKDDAASAHCDRKVGQHDCNDPELRWEPDPGGNLFVRAAKWAAGEVWEKVNLVGVWRELKALGKKHGKRFFWAALIWECIEDGLFPLLSWLFGVPELIPLFLIFHFEPIAYPAIFWLFRIWDRKKGLVPEHPERSAYSSSWRAWVKAFNYNLPALGFLGWTLVLFTDHANNFMATTYAGMMVLFYYIHDRIWHDSNYGIRPDDTVEFRRPLAKTVTHTIVAVMVMYPLMKAFMGEVNWAYLTGWQTCASLAYLGMELVWSKSQWGLEINPGVGTPPPWAREPIIRTPFGSRLNMHEVGRQMFPVEPMPEGAKPIYLKDDDLQVGGTD